jgi:hypothetical protein
MLLIIKDEENYRIPLHYRKLSGNRILIANDISRY